MLINLLILGLLVFYAVMGFRRGLYSQTFELGALVVSFALAVLLYQPVGGLLDHILSFPRGLLNLAAFFILWMLVEAILGVVWRLVRDKLPEEPDRLRRFGVIPALLRAVLLITILLTSVAAAPIADSAKAQITSAQLAQPFMTAGHALEPQFGALVGDALGEVLKFRTIKTEESTGTKLDFTTTKVKVCEKDESGMIDKVNEERTSRGLGRVTLDTELREVARAHSRDMFARGYFAHDDPDGNTPFDRIDAAGIKYRYAGENLALAPNLGIAHDGLMNSPGHRANILKPEYTRLGVGCMDAGIRGQMYSQEFAG